MGGDLKSSKPMTFVGSYGIPGFIWTYFHGSGQKEVGKYSKRKNHCGSLFHELGFCRNQFEMVGKSCFRGAEGAAPKKSGIRKN
jgi:hypothetical protein